MQFCRISGFQGHCKAGFLLDNDKPGSGFNTLIMGVKVGKRFKYLGLVDVGLTKPILREIITKSKARNTSIFSPVSHVNKRGPFRDRIKDPEIKWTEPLKCQVKYLELAIWYDASCIIYWFVCKR